jgi:fibronectin-binding autotransporter adhesin
MPPHHPQEVPRRMLHAARRAARGPVGALLLALALAPPAQALSLTWFGGDGHWDSAANWLPGGQAVPGDADLAILGAGAAMLDTARTVGAWSHSGGVLAGNGGLTVLGAADWTGGALLQAGTHRFLGATTITGDGAKLLGGRVLALEGATTWGGNTVLAGNKLVLNGARILNRGVFTDANALQTGIQTDSTTQGFDNAGSYVKVGNSETLISVPMANTGSVVARSGVLTLFGNVTGTGSYAIDGGARVQIGGLASVLDHATSSGAGTLVMAGLPSAVLTLKGGDFASAVNLNSGDIAGDGAVFRGPVTWSSATFTGPGTHRFEGRTILRPGDVISPVMGGARVEFAGETTWVSNPFGGGGLFFRGGTLVNRGSFTDDATSSRAMHDISGTNAFVNEGTYRKTGMETTDLRVAFTNTGLLTVQQGTLLMSRDFTNQGQLEVQGGALLDSDAALLANEGLLFGAGVVHVREGSALANRGELAAGGRSTIGTFTIAGNLALESGSVLAIDLDGAGAADVVHVSGGAHLGGRIAIQVLPSAALFVGQSFIVLAYDRLEGAQGFESIQWQGAGDFGFVAETHAQDVTLRVVAVPEPASWWLLAGGLCVVLRRRR